MQTLVRIMYCLPVHEPNGLEVFLTAMKKEKEIHLKDQLWKIFSAFSPNDRNWDVYLLVMSSKPSCKILPISKKPQLKNLTTSATLIIERFRVMNIYET